MTKKWYKSKGMWLGVLVTLGGILDFLTDFIMQGEFDEKSLILMVIGVSQIVIRAVTKEGVTV